MNRYLEILGLKPGVSFEEIKRAYKLQVKKWHPDRFPAEARHLQRKAHERFSQISDAFKQLEDYYKTRGTPQYAYEQPESEFQKPRTQPGHNPTPENPDYDFVPPDQSTENDDAPGFFTRTWPNGDKYESQIINNMMHGMGIYTSADGTVYTGQFRNGKPEGQGKLIFANGDVYTGGFKEDRLNGQGKYEYANGDRFIGRFKDDLPHGEGAHILTNGKIYAGMWEHGNLMQ